MDMEYQLILKIPLALITILEVLIATNIARQLYYKLRDDSLIDDRDKYRLVILNLEGCVSVE